jgi:ATP-dependent Clp protease ATP-binding subunit ClpX
MSVAVYNHYKRLMQQQVEEDVEIEKSQHHYGWTNWNRKNIGSQNHCKMLDVPLAIVDATVLPKQVMLVKMLKVF